MKTEDSIRIQYMIETSEEALSFVKNVTETGFSEKQDDNTLSY